MINFNPIKAAIFVGTCPHNDVDVERLYTGPGITAVLNLQTDEDFSVMGIDWELLDRQYTQRDIAVRRWPIRDFDPAHLEQRLAGAVARLDELLGAGHQVYVHCTAGVSRAPAVVIAYLSWCCGWDLDTAYQFVRSQRLCSPYLDSIRAATSHIVINGR